MPLILDLVHPKSIVDVGCGVGTWLSVFREQGVEDVLGVDGAYVDKGMLMIPHDRFLACDLSAPFRIERRFELVLCLEVAEHIPRESAEGFIACLTQLGPCVVFSAAIPFQGGTHHVNEQWPDYWIRHFNRNGYIAIDALRQMLWDEEGLDWWYAQNMFFFVNNEYLSSYPRLKNLLVDKNDLPISIVHPKNYIKAANLRRVSPLRLLSALPASFVFALERLMELAFRRKSRPF